MDQPIPLIVQKYINEIAQKHSKKQIQIKLKKNSKLMKAIGWFFDITKINQKFMTNYVTTIGNTIYFPEKLLMSENEISILEIMAHECIHIKDSNKFGLFFILSYLGPQIFAILSILSLVAIFASKFWLLFLLFLLFLAPIPSYGRYYWEKRAFRISLIFKKHYYNYNETELKKTRDWIILQMTKNFYYFAWPFPKWVEKDLKNMDFMETNEYKEIISFIKTNLSNNG